MNALMKKLLLTRSCKEVSALVIAREDRALPQAERMALRLHMAICRTCPVFERQVLTMRNAMKQWRHYSADDDSAS
jgi:Putative zinc-finger